MRFLGLLLVVAVCRMFSNLVLHALSKIVVQGPVPKDWQGFSVKFAESLKGTY